MGGESGLWNVRVEGWWMGGASERWSLGADQEGVEGQANGGGEVRTGC